MTTDFAPHRFMTLHEIARAAQRNLIPGVWDYLTGGTETETTVKRNRLAWDCMAFRPRVLQDVSNVDTSKTFLGKQLRLPIVLAPIGSVESFTPEGGAAAAKAAESFGVCTMLSSVCAPGLEAVAQSADAMRIFQLYVRGDGAWIDEHVKRAIDNGYCAFAITVDTAWYSRRERDIERRFVKAWRGISNEMTYQAALNWEDIKRFKDTHKIPLVLKGIATKEDALQACALGVDVIYVSNHGGRQLDHGRGSADVLPEIIQAVNGSAKVIVDGGIMRGTDVVKAMILGADAVGIGRLACMGMAADGAAGLVRVLELLEDEVQRALGLLGVTTYEGLDSSYLHAAPSVTAAHVTSALPLL